MVLAGAAVVVVVALMIVLRAHGGPNRCLAFLAGLGGGVALSLAVSYDDYATGFVVT